MKKYTCFDAPLRVFGIPFFDEKKKFERLPEQVRTKLSNLDFLGRRCPGARIGFRTNAEEFTVKIYLKTLSVDIGMSIFACQSAIVMVGDRQNSVFAGLVNPPDYKTMVFKNTVKKSSNMEDVTIWLMRNEEIENVEITIPDDALVEEPTPYKYGKALYYGSSITEGGCCSNITNAYNAFLSRWLDLDYYNFGFSGNAKGESEIANYINTIDMSIFIMDYDHNAPTVQHLKQTHEPFYQRIRVQNPDIPILLLTRPNFAHTEDAKDRRIVIEQTYKNAVRSGDKNIYYIDGETFFAGEDGQLCTVDMTHPNDLGMYRMAKTILPVMKKMLNIV